VNSRSWKSVIALAAMLALVVMVLAHLYSSDSQREAEPAASPSVPSPSGFSRIATLDPPLGGTSLFEDHPAVQSLRERKKVWAWAILTNDASSSQVFQYFDVEERKDLNEGGGWYYQSEYWVPIGPSGMTVLDVVDDPDGSARVTYCSVDGYRVRASDGLADSMDRNRPGGTVVENVLSPPTDEEIEELRGWGLDAPAYLFRESRYLTDQSCDPTAVVLQRFVDWEQYAPIGSYVVRDPWGVTVVGEDEPRDREDMP
jgi:hypothetical protein